MSEGGGMLVKLSERFFCMLVLLALLSGCAGGGQAQKASPADVAKQAANYDALMKQAVDTQAAGKYDQAAAQFQALAKTYPAKKEPWQKLAQMHFDHYRYGSAIVAAEEVLRIDPSDQLGNSILAVAGLRVSTSALATLRGRNYLVGNVKAEASSLAAILRENLGEPVLVPATTDAPKPRVRVAPKSVPKTTAPASAAGTKNSADPFDSLK